MVSCKYSNKKQTFVVIAIITTAVRDIIYFIFKLNDSIMSKLVQTMIITADSILNLKEMARYINNLLDERYLNNHF